MLRRRVLVAFLMAALLFPSGADLALAQKKPAAAKERADSSAALRASVARFRQRVEAELAKEKAQRGDWGVLVVDAATGETLYAFNADRYFTPASNTKMYTTALAMATLGPDYRFRTTLETRGRIDSFGRLRGDLVLVGRGDPNLSNRKFPYDQKAETEGPPDKVVAALADAIVARGIRQVEGDVVSDDSFFVYDRYPPGWAIDDMTGGYGAPVSAIALNDNTLAIEVRAGQIEGQPAWFNVEPWADFYQFTSELTTGAKGSALRLFADREPGSHRVMLRGSIPLGSEPQTLALAIEEPAEFTAALLKRLLEARGVRVYGAARGRHTAEAPAEPPLVLAEHVSLPLTDAVRAINKVSQNLHTEMLLRVVARERTGIGSTAEGLKVEQEFFKTAGIREGDVAVHDGSGLSRMNLITPRSAVALLQFVAKQPWAEAYLSSLPVAGEDGTLNRRMKDTPAAGHIQAKTGTLGSVNAVSGYATTVHGTRLVFSIFGNKHNLRGRDATDVLDAICVAMVEEIGPAPEKKKR